MFNYDDLIIKLPSLSREDLNIKIKTIFNKNLTTNIYDINPKLISKYEVDIDKEIDIIKWNKYKSLSILLNPYALVNINNSEYKQLEYAFKFKQITKCTEKKKILSRAYYKMWEMILHFNLIESSYKDGLVCANVAEGPGGFIQAIIYYRIKYGAKDNFKKDKLYGITIKDISDNLRFDKNKLSNKFIDFYGNKLGLLNISYGGDNGDITKINVIKNYIKLFSKRKAHLCTADGGIEAKSAIIKEAVNALIIINETIIALSVLALGGHFVLKIYTVTTYTIDLLQLLSYYFDEVYITKPVTSRLFNSEKYIVAKKFKGISSCELDKLYQLSVDLKKIEKDNYIISIFDNKINEELLNKINEYNENHYLLRKKYMKKMNNFNMKDYKNINKLLSFNQDTSLEWCDKMKLDFLIEN